MHLLDVNMLIARADSAHPHHATVAQWMADHAADGWASCPLTENGMLRILGHPSYPHGPGNPEAALVSIRKILAIPGHRFFPDDFSLHDALPTLKGVNSGQLTDLYLLALAIRNNARFLTLDQRIDPHLVPGGVAAYVHLAP